MKTLYLFDSFALAFRIFYAFSRNPLINSRGQNTSLVHGYWSNVLRILALRRPTHAAIVRDMGSQTFRHHLYPDYKANRGEMPEEMRTQMPMFEAMLRASGIALLGMEGYEADDLMASVARRAEQEGFEVFLVTKDKDMAQIVSERIRLFHLEKGNDVVLMGPDEVVEKFGVPPEQIRDYLALVGDSSDNIPGVPQIGPKTAAELLRTYRNLDEIYANLPSIAKKSLRENLERHRENAYISRELVTLQVTHDFGISLDQLVFRGLDREAMERLCREYELRALARQLQTVPDRREAVQVSVLSDGGAPLVETVVEARRINRFEDILGELSQVSPESPIAWSFAADSAVGWQAKPSGIAWAFRDTRVWFMSCDLSVEWAEIVKNVWEYACGRGHRMLAHDAKFAIQILEQMGVPAGNTPWDDTQLAAWILDPGHTPADLDGLVAQRLGERGRGASECPPYAENAANIWCLWRDLEPELVRKGVEKAYQQVEKPLIPVLARMERAGIAIDTEELERIRAELAERLKILEEEIYRQAGGRMFNINSPKQLGTVLFEDLGLPVIKKNSTGYSTDAAVLEELRGIHPIVELVVRYRELGKLLNTYVDVLPKLVHPQTGRVHTQLIQTGTATGRLSSRDPNLQNIPIRTAEGKRIRAAFVGADPDAVLISADYSQIELRMLAHLSGDRHLTEAYRQGIDIHTRTASAIFKVPQEQVSADMRRQAKVVNFGVLYGMTAFRLARDMGISRAEAKSFIDGYFELYGEVRNWIERTVRQARECGFVETITGRRRYIPGIGSADNTERQMAERMAINTPVQGSAADLIKIAMARIDQRIRKENSPARLLLQVHDELVFECPAADAESAVAWIRAEMENAWDLSVPLRVDARWGRNWLVAH